MERWGAFLDAFGYLGACSMALVIQFAWIKTLQMPGEEQKGGES